MQDFLTLAKERYSVRRLSGERIGRSGRGTGLRVAELDVSGTRTL